MNDLTRIPGMTSARRPAGMPRINADELIIITVGGKVAHPTRGKSVYRIGQDGLPRALPGTGGIVPNFRVGDRCVGLAADHAEPGVSIRNDDAVLKGEKDAQNLALNTYACIGNTVSVLDGPCRGKRGVVTGKHGGVAHVLADFPGSVLGRLRLGDPLQIYAHGLGMRLVDYPGVHVHSCSPRLIRAWGLAADGRRIRVPVTHLIPAAVMGSGIGRDNTVMGDYDIQLFDEATRRRYGLGSLRIGDIVAIAGADNRFGRAWHQGYLTIGIVVHGDSSVSGHGPGVTTLLTGEARYLEPLRDRGANLARLLKLRAPQPPRQHPTLLDKDRRRPAGRPSTGNRRPTAPG